jgi:catechol 2,3-dioxygenase-like lactoylglutathione lyase family enzyme
VPLRRHTGIETKRAGHFGSLLHRVRRRRRNVRNRKEPGLARFSGRHVGYIEVDDFEVAREHLRDHGVAFFLGPTETKVCHWAAFRDPDGNRLVIHKRK